MFNFFRKKTKANSYILKDIEAIKKCETLHELYLWERKQNKPATQNFKTWLTVIKIKSEATL